MKKIYIILISIVIYLIGFILGFFIKYFDPEITREVVLILDNKAIVTLSEMEDIDFVETILLNAKKYQTESEFDLNFINKALITINNPHNKTILFNGIVYSYNDHCLIEINDGESKNYIRLNKNESVFFESLISP